MSLIRVGVRLQQIGPPGKDLRNPDLECSVIDFNVFVFDALSWKISLQVQLQEETLEKDQAGLVNTVYFPLRLFSARTTNSSRAGEKPCNLEQQSLFCTDILVMSLLNNKRFVIEPEVFASSSFVKMAKLTFFSGWICNVMHKKTD